MFKKPTLEAFLATYTHSIEVVRSKKARAISLRIYIGGQVRLRLPSRMRDSIAINFLTDRNSWLTEVLDKKRIVREKIVGSSNAKKLENFSNEHYQSHKLAAQELVESKVSHLNIHNWPVGRISVKQMKTRWGSCSTKTNLNFNYKILFLPADLQDYLIIHELCHLRHHNHSADFWSEVALMCSDYKTLDKKLRSL